jgi:hypothetical protein
MYSRPSPEETSDPGETAVKESPRLGFRGGAEVSRYGRALVQRVARAATATVAAADTILTAAYHVANKASLQRAGRGVVLPACDRSTQRHRRRRLIPLQRLGHLVILDPLSDATAA